MDNYYWTGHSLMKMRYYGLSQQRIKRVIKNPERIEEGIVEKTIACMQTAGSSKHPYEIWIMYQIGNYKSQKTKHPAESGPRQGGGKQITNSDYQNSKIGFANNPMKLKAKKLKIISAWRYPGKSPKNNPIPEEILNEIRSLI